MSNFSSVQFEFNSALTYGPKVSSDTKKDTVNNLIVARFLSKISILFGIGVEICDAMRSHKVPN